MLTITGFLILCAAVTQWEGVVTAQKAEKDYDYVDVEHLQHGVDGLDLKMKVFGKNYELNLKEKPSVFSKNLKIMTIENGKIKQVPYKGEIPKLYVDSKTKTVLHVDKTEDKVRLEGVLSGDISLLSTQGSRSDKPAVAVRAKNQEKKISYKVPPTPLMANFQQIRAVNLSVPKVVQPELFIVVDYVNFKQLDFDNTKLLKYLSVFWTSVNTIYSQLKDPEVQLSVSGVLPIKNPKDQPFIEYGLKYFPSGKQLLDLNICLPAVSMFLFSAIDQLGYFDVGMLMTAEDMAVVNEKTGSYMPEVAGVAPVAGACTVDIVNHMMGNIGMAEDKFPYYDGLLNHAHEVAHLLGAAHDGDEPVAFLPGHPGAADCPWSDGYLMSYQFGTKNHLRWSECTEEQIHWLVHNPQRGMCLRDSPGYPPIFDESQSLAGELVSLDEQCQAMLGESGKFYVGENRADVCVVLFCMNGLQGPVARGPALEGTPCNKMGTKWCIHGECVSKPSKH